jgi:hypothetical protein
MQRNFETKPIRRAVVETPGASQEVSGSGCDFIGQPILEEWQASCEGPFVAPKAVRHVPKRIAWSIEMKQRVHRGNETQSARQEAALIKTMIIDLDRIVQLLNCDIAYEEERSRVSDRSDPAYPILARTLSARRDNLQVTISILEKRLALAGEISLPAIATAA